METTDSDPTDAEEACFERGRRRRDPDGDGGRLPADESRICEI